MEGINYKKYAGKAITSGLGLVMFLQSAYAAGIEKIVSEKVSIPSSLLAYNNTTNNYPLLLAANEPLPNQAPIPKAAPIPQPPKKEKKVKAVKPPKVPKQDSWLGRNWPYVAGGALLIGAGAYFATRPKDEEEEKPQEEGGGGGGGEEEQPPEDIDDNDDIQPAGYNPLRQNYVTFRRISSTENKTVKSMLGGLEVRIVIPISF